VVSDAAGVGTPLSALPLLTLSRGANHDACMPDHLSEHVKDVLGRWCGDGIHLVDDGGAMATPNRSRCIDLEVTMAVFACALHAGKLHGCEFPPAGDAHGTIRYHPDRDVNAAVTTLMAKHAALVRP
jgi:hypothetical protein